MGQGHLQQPLYHLHLLCWCRIYTHLMRPALNLSDSNLQQELYHLHLLCWRRIYTHLRFALNLPDIGQGNLQQALYHLHLLCWRRIYTHLMRPARILLGN